MKTYRFDLILSYWIFAWYLLYMLNIVKVPPQLAILLGIAVNIVLIITFIILKVDISLIVLFGMNMVAVKIIPYWTLRKKHMDLEKQSIYLIGLFCVYLTWLFFNGINVFDILRGATRSFTQGKMSEKYSPDSALILDIVHYVIHSMRR